MAHFSNVVETQIANWMFRNTDMPTAPTSVYVSMHTADPGDTGASETTYTSYARVAVSTTAGWTAPAAGGGGRFSENVAAVAFPTVGATGATVGWYGLWDALTSGNYLGTIPMAATRALVTGDPPQANAGDLDFTVTGLSTYLADIVLKWMFRNTAAAGAPNDVFAALFSADPGLTGANELTSTGGYSRKGATTGTAGSGASSAFDAPTNGVTTNNAVITLDTNGATASANYSATATHGGFFDAITAGNYLWGAALALAQTVLSADPVPSFAAGDVDFQIS